MQDTLAPSRPPLTRPVSTQPLQIYWSYALIVISIHLMALLAFVPSLFSWAGVATCFVGLYLFGTLGINLCYHRCLTHQSLALPTWLERTFATLGICCLQDSPARWVAVHRLHHQHSDEEPDPHSPLVHFFWGHLGWILVKNAWHDSTYHYERYCRDVLRDRYYFWCERRLRWFWIYLGHALLLFAVAWLATWLAYRDWRVAGQLATSILVWGVFVRTVLVWHITWSVNSIGHCFGYRNYDTDDASRNNVLIGLVSNGEGWHNNHHAHQRCAAHGHKWWELDVTFWTIRLLECCGLAREVVRHPLAGRKPLEVASVD